MRCEGSEKREEWRRGPADWNLVLLCLERGRRGRERGDEGEREEREGEGR